MLEHEQPSADAHGGLRRLRRAACAGPQHLPGGGGRNRYSVPCELAGKMVSSRLYPSVSTVDEVADDEPPPPLDRDQALRLAALPPLIERKPGALRNGAPLPRCRAVAATATPCCCAATAATG